MPKEILVILFCLTFAGNLFAADKLDFSILGYDIEGMRLGLNLDEAKKRYNINNDNPIKDSRGIISGYEVTKSIRQKRVVLNFTGEKRLYNIHYYNYFPRFKGRSMALLDRIKQKYGEPTSTGQRQNSIVACWGNPCKRFSPRSPYLRAIIFAKSGRAELILYHKGMLQSDWKKYKQKSNRSGGRRRSFREQQETELDF
ncbi:MAG: hypothetical protein COB67_01590 [SAR324 cluster bacterium]|uniref:Uncharacterized protein n=1 Tax=SAR324 cluster bacterium TaxID=2024889 RepID=A0A2A4TAW9_9DELT|nr:MAG: hypothetical protein COB67_01590 [SAR324 cluster bacterium]